MTDQKELDALSDRVAKVLGWQTLQLGWIRSAKLACPPVNIDDFQCLPAYASDWSLLPEMLAWLREQEVVALLTEGYVTEGWSATNRTGEQRERGDTLPEAVARLVVAVADKEASK